MNAFHFTSSVSALKQLNSFAAYDKDMIETKLCTSVSKLIREPAIGKIIYQKLPGRNNGKNIFSAKKNCNTQVSKVYILYCKLANNLVCDLFCHLK